GKRLLRRGQDRYEIFCSHCHGLSGLGDGIVISKGMTPPPSYHDAQRRSYPVGRFFDIITHGGEQMPSLAAQIPVEDRWAIAAYVRALQLSRNVAYGDVPKEVKEEEGWK